ncbi:S-adenosyl-L-methionine-dependent methyltransferase [Penicillium paradoxum]|uniref:S-adenosyl-L-methionine-dependent methyltransferase n=1 Tax=Penicillium paradoxum TaxID=176176 RepID=UPI002548D80C|nr:S-adenosyl-L-methionine-dependent methyltransferase [Penicillium paradoxum]KAJ5788400.1 S-adenosyl-L-methionine-dependent methyltransferase [Penicillium paradoxum]
MENETFKTMNTPVSMRGAGVYNENSQFQRRALSTCFKLLPVTVSQTGSNVTIADYGCSEGSNSSLTANTLEGPRVLPLMAPKSYYEQVLPAGSVDIGVSTSSLNWLPCLQVARETPLPAEEVCAAAMKDLTCFLQHRHVEVRPGGTLLLCLPIDGELNFDSPIQALRGAIQDVAGRPTAAAYQEPVYFRKREDVDTILKELEADWQIVDLFEQDVVHPASARAQSLISDTCTSFDQDVLIPCAKTLCDWTLAIAANSTINIIRLFERRARNLDNTEEEDTDQRLLDTLSEALFRRLLRIDWTRPIGSRYLSVKLQRI